MAGQDSEPWQEEHCGVRMRRRLSKGAPEFFCTITSASGAMHTLTADSPDKLRAVIDVELARKD